MGTGVNGQWSTKNKITTHEIRRLNRKQKQKTKPKPTYEFIFTCCYTILCSHQELLLSIDQNIFLKSFIVCLLPIIYAYDGYFGQLPLIPNLISICNNNRTFSQQNNSIKPHPKYLICNINSDQYMNFIMIHVYILFCNLKNEYDKCYYIVGNIKYI